ncbi:YqiA/YcfP family alpha/beta fold hydrolase [Microcystis aeruginosa]|uniref:YqiA/YcfP family alpha/beta fold hydrolase n=1 Tax=Microcystis aeruginosa TaxID=1126 RepID=UPI0018817CAD|nr:YqiA/YcfP family alpha/beta fold hydrolase [Microcystis aeruginosa]MBE8993523.1 esterase [Microcystis aeruginosa LEGE 91341]
MAVLENRYIYLHGFASGPQSTKAQFLRHCWQKKGLAMEIPDLNGDDFSSLTLTRQIVQVGQLIEQSQLPVTLIGSSFGGLTAAWLAETYFQVQRFVLLAPAFNFGPIWLGQLGAETLANWQKSGSLSVYHHGYRRSLPIDYKFIEDLANYPQEKLIRQLPTLIIHGSNDGVIPPENSRYYAFFRPWVQLIELNSDHDLTDVLTRIWAEIQLFLNF